MRCHRKPRIGRLRNFLQGFLDLVFAEIALPGVGGGADGVDGMGLGDGDQPDVVGSTPGAAGRVRDALANARPAVAGMCSYTRTLGTSGTVKRRYFFNCAIIPFACVAYWPSGASFT